MPKYTIITMPGDGIGNQVLPESLRVLKAVAFDAEYIHADIDGTAGAHRAMRCPTGRSSY